MAELPKLAEEAVKKIDTKLECSICLENFKEPKLLPCFHIFCKTPCLEKLVVQDREGKSLTCPTCRQLVPLSDNGVAGLQTDFHIDHLFEIRESLEKAKNTNYENCTTSPATGYCHDCKNFLCDKCTEIHKAWKKNVGHKLLGLNDVKADAVNVLVPVKQIPQCKKHSKMELKIYCETCSELVCSDCTIRLHRNHNYDLVENVFPKHKEEIVTHLEPLKEKLDKVQQALKAFEIKAKEVNNQRATVEADIHREIDQLHQLIDQRRVELIGSLDLQTQQKLKELATQRDHVEMTQASLSSCLEYAKGGLESGTEGEVLAMKIPVLKRIEQITADFDPATIQPQTEADIKFVAFRIELACMELGDITTQQSISARHTYATGDILESAISGEQAIVQLQAMTRNLNLCEEKLETTAKLVHTKSRSTIECEVKQENGRHTIIYQPTKRGKHSLSIRINEKHIQGSPYPIAVTPSPQSLCKPVRVVGGLKGPYGVTINSKGHTVVADYKGHSILVLTPQGERIHQFGTLGSEEGQLKHPVGVAVDGDDNIYVVDYINVRIQKFNSKGEFIKAAGGPGCGNLEFSQPLGICFNRKNDFLYVCDRKNHRVQVISKDLTFKKSFGTHGSGNGQFQRVEYAAFDDANNLYVTDHDNHRVQMFTDDGQFIRVFTNKANGEKLQSPYAIAIDSSNMVYVSELTGHCVSLFTPRGDYITTFSGNTQGPVYGLCVDQNDSVIVSDYSNNRLQIF